MQHLQSTKHASTKVPEARARVTRSLEGRQLGAPGARPEEGDSGRENKDDTAGLRSGHGHGHGHGPGSGLALADVQAGAPGGAG